MRACRSPCRRRERAFVPWRRAQHPSPPAASVSAASNRCRGAFIWSGSSVDAMPCMMGFARTPDLKCASCRVIYSAGCPARLGFAGTTLFPPGPWHARQTSLAVFCARSRSGFAGLAPARRCRCGCAELRLRRQRAGNGRQQQNASHRVTPRRQRRRAGGGLRLLPSAQCRSKRAKTRIVTESPSPAQANRATSRPKPLPIRCSTPNSCRASRTKASCRRRERRRSPSRAARMQASRVRSMRSPIARVSRSRARCRAARSRSISSACAAARCSPIFRATAMRRSRVN